MRPEERMAQEYSHRIIKQACADKTLTAEQKEVMQMLGNSMLIAWLQGYYTAQDMIRVPVAGKA